MPDEASSTAARPAYIGVPRPSRARATSPGTLVALTADSTTAGTILGISAQGLTTGKAIDVSLGTLYSGTTDL